MLVGVEAPENYADRFRHNLAYKHHVSRLAPFALVSDVRLPLGLYLVRRDPPQCALEIDSHVYQEVFTLHRTCPFMAISAKIN